MAAADVVSPTRVLDAKALGSLVRRARKRSGVTQAEAAGLAGVGVRFLSELERGKSTAELGLVIRVLGRLGLELWIKPRGSAIADVQP